MTSFPTTLRATDNRFVSTDKAYSLVVQNNRADRFIIVGDNGLARSEDGTNWTVDLGISNAGQAIAFGPDRWCKIRFEGTTNIPYFQTSFDGIKWNNIALPANWPGASSIIRIQQLQWNAANNLWYVTYIAGNPAAYPYPGYVSVGTLSPDLSTFTLLDQVGFLSSTYNAQTLNLSDLVVNGLTLAFAYATNNANPATNRGYVRKSIDGGLNWTESTALGATTNIYSFNYFNGKYYLGIQSAGVLTSTDAVTWAGPIYYNTAAPLAVGTASNNVILGVVNGAQVNLTYDAANNFAPQLNNPALAPAFNTPSGFTPVPFVSMFQFKGVNYAGTIAFMGRGVASGLYPIEVSSIIMGSDPFTQATVDVTVKPGLSDIQYLRDIGVRLT